MINTSLQNTKPKTLGAFLGVFTPTLLTILGVIMYLRFGWMIGNLGLAGSLLVILLANSITLITTWSFSAIATNTHVGGGGAYFIISRSLGLPIGAAIGVPLFLSQVLSITLYSFGLAETLHLFGNEIPLKLSVVIIIFIVGAISMRGANIALRTQIPLMILVFISLFALTIGAIMSPKIESTTQIIYESASFWTVFAVFFPAVTGVMAGLGLSGDLKNPRTSIPKGSISAVLVGFIVYIGVTFLLFQSADAYSLHEDPLIWTRIAPTFLILPGLCGAILSSAIGATLSAPRTLQALLEDYATENSFIKRIFVKPDSEPILCLLISLCIALLTVSLGNLNTVAEMVSLCFLTVYGTINLVATLETLSGNSTWRPRLRVSWFLSLCTSIACFSVMILLNPLISFITICGEICLWFIFKRIVKHTEWGDLRRDIYEALIRWALLKLKKRPITARNWRPHVFIFADQIENRSEILNYAHGFTSGRGVMTVCELMVGNMLDDNINLSKRRDEIETYLEKKKMIAFAKVDIVNSLEQGMINVVQANGWAGLESNTILLGWRNNLETLSKMLETSRYFSYMNKSLIIVRPSNNNIINTKKEKQIDIWWGGIQSNGDLMLLLAYLLTRNPPWVNAKIRVLSITSNQSTQKDTEKNLEKLMQEFRIKAETYVFKKSQDKSIQDIINTHSKNSDIIFLGLAIPEPGQEQNYAKHMQEMSENLPTVLFVRNSSLFVGRLVSS